MSLEVGTPPSVFLQNYQQSYHKNSHRLNYFQQVNFQTSECHFSMILLQSCFFIYRDSMHTVNGAQVIERMQEWPNCKKVPWLKNSYHYCLKDSLMMSIWIIFFVIALIYRIRSKIIEKNVTVCVINIRYGSRYVDGHNRKLLKKDFNESETEILYEPRKN